jgi:hypothetical protein
MLATWQRLTAPAAGTVVGAETGVDVCVGVAVAVEPLDEQPAIVSPAVKTPAAITVDVLFYPSSRRRVPPIPMRQKKLTDKSGHEFI